MIGAVNIPLSITHSSLDSFFRGIIPIHAFKYQVWWAIVNFSQCSQCCTLLFFSEASKQLNYLCCCFYRIFTNPINCCYQFLLVIVQDVFRCKEIEDFDFQIIC